MEAYRITVDLVTGIAWPVAVGGLVSFFLYKYRVEVGELLRRVRAVSLPFAFVTADQEAPKDVEKAVGELSKTTGEKGAGPARTVGTTQDWEQRAVEYKTALIYEQAYRVIFGTQLDLLRFLNLNQAGLSADELDYFYQMHLTTVRSASPSRGSYHIPREQFLSFLTSWGLVQVTDNRYAITDFGQGFLEYLTRARIPPVKPY